MLGGRWIVVNPAVKIATDVHQVRRIVIAATATAKKMVDVMRGVLRQTPRVYVGNVWAFAEPA